MRPTLGSKVCQMTFGPLTLILNKYCKVNKSARNFELMVAGNFRASNWIEMPFGGIRTVSTLPKNRQILLS